MVSSFQTPRQNIEVSAQYLKHLVGVVNQIMRGKTNNIGEVTLTPSQATTVVTDPKAGIDSHIDFMPLTENAATEYVGGMYVSSQGKETFTITHANNAQTDRDFRYVITG